MKPNLKGYDSSRSYAMELKQLIEERTGKECESWLYPQIRSAARNELLLDKMQPDGLAVVMEADHYCMKWRGVKDADSKMTNSIMRGLFLKNPDLRREFLSLLAGRMK